MTDEIGTTLQGLIIFTLGGARVDETMTETDKVRKRNEQLRTVKNRLAISWRYFITRATINVCINVW